MGTNWQIILLVIVVVIVLVFIIISSITSKKNQKREQTKRKKVVREEIKSYLAKEMNLKNLRLEYEKVYARKGVEYKYRDVFDVIVQLYDAKTNKLIAIKAFEIEGMTTRADRKTYTTTWNVNGESDIEDTKRRIAIAEKKVKLTKEEKKTIKADEAAKAKAEALKIREKQKELKLQKSEQKKLPPSNTIDPVKKATAVKFVPRRNK